MLKIKSEEVANISFDTFRQIILEKEKKKASSCNILIVFCFSDFYSNKQRGESKELENLARRPKYILFIKKIR